MLSGELGVSQVFLAPCYIGGGYMDVPEVVVFMTVAKYTSSTRILSLSVGESVSPCEVMSQVAGYKTVVFLTYPTPCLIAYNSTGMMNLKTAE